MRQYCGALRFATAELCADREIVLTAVTQNPNALCYASESLRENRSLILAAVKKEGLALRYAPHRFREDSGILLGAARQDCQALEFATGELQPVRMDWRALAFASKEFWQERRAVLLLLTDDAGPEVNSLMKRLPGMVAAVGTAQATTTAAGREGEPPLAAPCGSPEPPGPGQFHMLSSE